MKGLCSIFICSSVVPLPFSVRLDTGVCVLQRTEERDPACFLFCYSCLGRYSARLSLALPLCVFYVVLVRRECARMPPFHCPFCSPPFQHFRVASFTPTSSCNATPTCVGARCLFLVAMRLVFNVSSTGVADAGNSNPFFYLFFFRLASRLVDALHSVRDFCGGCVCIYRSVCSSFM